MQMLSSFFKKGGGWGRGNNCTMQSKWQTCSAGRQPGERERERVTERQSQTERGGVLTALCKMSTSSADANIVLQSSMWRPRLASVALSGRPVASGEPPSSPGYSLVLFRVCSFPFGSIFSPGGAAISRDRRGLKITSRDDRNSRQCLFFFFF